MRSSRVPVQVPRQGAACGSDEAVTAGVGKRDRRNGEVTSLLRGLAVLRSFGGTELALGNGDIALRTGLPRSTVSRITATLAAHGYLDVDEARRRYRPGPAALLLGYAQMTNWNFAQLAKPYLQPLANYSHAVVGVGAPLDNSMVYVGCQRGPADVDVQLDVGSRVPMDRSAIGWAYLYALDRSKRERVLVRLRQHRPDDWAKVERAMQRAFGEIETRGFCLAAGFWKPDISAVGVPLRIPNRGMYLGLNCGAPCFSLSTEDLVKDVGPRLVQAAKRICVSALQMR